MIILAIDPGTTESGFVLFQNGTVIESGVIHNDGIRELIKFQMYDLLAIEMIASYGMPVGKEVFETVLWVGRYIELTKSTYKLIYRKDVKMHLCGSMKAKDPNIKQALIDKLGPVGTVKQKGPLYGVKSHAWSALAVAVTAMNN